MTTWEWWTHNNTQHLFRVRVIFPTHIPIHLCKYVSECVWNEVLQFDNEVFIPTIVACVHGTCRKLFYLLPGLLVKGQSYHHDYSYIIIIISIYTRYTLSAD